MRNLAAALTVLTLVISSTGILCAEGLPISKYMEDPEHKNDIVGFYLNAVFSGINLANERISPPLFCMNENGQESAFNKIDNRINKLKKEGRLSAEMTVDSIMLDILIEEYPCKSVSK